MNHLFAKLIVSGVILVTGVVNAQTFDESIYSGPRFQDSGLSWTLS